MSTKLSELQGYQNKINEMIHRADDVFTLVSWLTGIIIMTGVSVYVIRLTLQYGFAL